MLSTLLVTCGFLATLVTAQTYYILPTDTSQCPSNNPTVDSCFTLNEYALLWLYSDAPVTNDSAVSLIFVPGQHALSVRLEIQNIARLVLRAEQTNTSPTLTLLSTITCTNSSGFLFENITEVTIRGIGFSKCLENSANSIKLLSIGQCRFETGNGIGLINVEKGTLETSSFISLTASFGGSESGGALYAIDSNINIKECLFEFNTARIDGGAIWTQTGNTSLYRNTFNSNTANDDGGAVYMGTIKIVIDNCIFNNNSANDDGGAIYSLESGEIRNSGFSSNAAGDDGGAVYMVDGGQICNSDFTSNTAKDNGGAIQSDDNIELLYSNFSLNLANDRDGGAVHTLEGNIRVVRCNFISNTVVGQQGGAVHSFRGTIDIQDSIFSNNSAATKDGGAICTSSGTINVKNSLLSFNSANQSGGAILSSIGDINMQGCNFTGNEAKEDGGAIRSFSGNINAQGCEFSANTAVNDGGAIRTLGSIVTRSSSFIDNRAEQGGALWAGDDLDIVRTDFLTNSASSDGGAIYFDGATGEDNSIIIDCILNDNYAANKGGAMYIRALSSDLRFFGFLTISNNLAETGTIYAQQSSLVFSGNVTISENKASFYAIASNIRFSGNTAFLNNSHKQMNATDEEGGALTALQSDISFSRTLVMMFNTISNGRGGAILAEKSSISFSGDTTITDNTALIGGGIHADESTLNFQGRTIITNNIDTESSSPQEDCPDPASMCLDVCNGEQCPRYLNAECQVNTCQGLCTPTFFWNGRNVTDRCPVERCSDKICPGRRTCIEEIWPATCPTGQLLSSCRQHITAKCVLPPEPTDCSQLSCERGMFCKERNNRQGVRCVRAQNCEQLTCDEGTICSQTEQGPECVKSIGLSCGELSCPKGTVCVTDSLPSLNLTVAQCLDENIACKLPKIDTFFCNSGDRICDESENEICVDIFENGEYLIPGCQDTGCDPMESPSSCPSGRVCAATPDFLTAPFKTSCVSSTTTFSSNTTCSDLPPDRCPSNFVCRDVFFEGQMYFTTCGAPSRGGFTAPSCAELVCDEPLKCNELGVVEGRGGVARCAGPEFTGDHEAYIRSLLNKIDI